MKRMRDRTYTTEQIVRYGREIYEREVRAKVAPPTLPSADIEVLGLPIIGSAESI